MKLNKIDDVYPSSIFSVLVPSGLNSPKPQILKLQIQANPRFHPSDPCDSTARNIGFGPESAAAPTITQEFRTPPRRLISSLDVVGSKRDDGLESLYYVIAKQSTHLAFTTTSTSPCQLAKTLATKGSGLWLESTIDACYMDAHSRGNGFLGD
ncbi:unnamed protein product [Linum trigynum]|uniref:Uncharacterized protein n=1 Tax=Linum trigynum TaxID=586398 RepID=A0AAV2DZ67_9ROSI